MQLHLLGHTADIDSTGLADLGYLVAHACLTRATATVEYGNATSAEIKPSVLEIRDPPFTDTIFGLGVLEPGRETFKICH
jgi:hypothetical protein